MNELLLRTHLAFAVPLRIDELRGQPDTTLQRIWTGVRDRLQTGADSMQFGGGTPGDTGRSVGAWTTAFALLALQADGGVDFIGLHWCAIPHCRAASRFDHADDTEPRPRPPPRRPIEDLPDITTWTT
jgi:hypothetical protein